ncbi:hypothetical protein ABVV53_02285 [Novosphingobium sp. RD2P27]|uniref:Uncharacterized protein n=1 Tax=Novosphingobium kalidii TaxID=3230299 RepID=A0ABV2CXG5_9SPHN
MDLNQLLYQHQVAVIRTGAEPVTDFGSRFDIVSHYERRIVKMREKLGVPQYPTWIESGTHAAD